MADIKLIPKLLIFSRNLVSILLWFHLLSFRGLGYLGAMLVSASQIPSLIADQTMITRQNISRNGGISMTNVRLVVDVVDWGCNIELIHIIYTSVGVSPPD